MANQKHLLPFKVPRFRKGNGRCYELTGRTVLMNPDVPLILVHGHGRGIPIERIHHAWIQFEKWIYDPALRIYTDADEYMRRFDAVAVVCYPARNAIHAMGESGHYGPWHEEGV